MAVSVRIPNPLRALTNDVPVVDAEAGTVGELVESLEGSYPGMRERLLDDGSGELRRFVNVYVNGEDVRFLDGLFRFVVLPGCPIQVAECNIYVACINIQR